MMSERNFQSCSIFEPIFVAQHFVQTGFLLEESEGDMRKTEIVAIFGRKIEGDSEEIILLICLSKLFVCFIGYY